MVEQFFLLTQTFIFVSKSKLEILARSASKINQSRICGKGVGLGLFLSDLLQFQLYEFIEIAHIDHTMV